MAWYHPKHYAELRKIWKKEAASNKLQAASKVNPRILGTKLGTKLGKNCYKLIKPKASSIKPQATSDTSNKQQAPSDKQQASSRKQQAPR
tara:strand:+ start:279 stop:548 length:270 start_codon:yes stop_codon:yes gene_type:complete